MAMVLLLLLLAVGLGQDNLIGIAIVAHLINMIYPPIYRPLAVLWFGLSHVTGALASRILLTIIFFTIVLPMSVARRLLGKDSLRLKRFKVGQESVMLVRNHTFVARDLEKPYEHQNAYNMNFLKDLVGFLQERRKLWLLPLVVILLLFGAVIVLTSGSAIAPFIYTLF